MSIIRGAKKTLRNIVLAGCVAVCMLLPMGCGDSGGDSGSSNNAPNFTSSIGSTTGQVGVNYNHDADAIDPDGDTVTFSLAEYPTGMTINENTGVINWIPSAGQQSMNHDITIRASDGDKSTTQSWGVYISGTGDPTFTSTPDTLATEGHLHNPDADATDPDSDPLTYSLAQAPSGMSIDPDTGVISWTPTIAQERQNHDVTIYADDDFGGHAEQSYQVYVRGRENVSFNIKEAGTGTGLGAIDTKVTDAEEAGLIYEATSVSGGTVTVANVPDGKHPLQFKDSMGVYETHKAGNIDMSGPKSGLEVFLYKQADRQFQNETNRLNGMVNRPAQKYAIKIYTYNDTNVRVSDAEINQQKDIAKTDFSDFYNENYTDADITLVEGIAPLTQPNDGEIWVIFDNSIGSNGANFSYLNAQGNVLSGISVLKENRSRGVGVQEMLEAGKNGGESNQKTSVLNDPIGGIINMQPADYEVSDVFNNRPTGNRNFGSTDNYDSNPSNYNFNTKTFD